MARVLGVLLHSFRTLSGSTEPYSCVNQGAFGAYLCVCFSSMLELGQRANTSSINRVSKLYYDR